MDIPTTTALAITLAVLTMCQTANAVVVMEAPMTLKSQSIARFARATLFQRTAMRTALMNLATRKRSADGWTFDPCQKRKDCRGPRACVTASLDEPCGPTTSPCFCFPPSLQICGNCKACLKFPKETCVTVPGENGQGYCGSSFTVFEGILAEKGCDSYPEIEPVPLSY